MRFGEPNDPPPKDQFFGGSFDYIESGETSKHRHRGHRHKEEDGGREKDCPHLATIAEQRGKHRESHAISSEAIAANHREQTRRAATQTPIPLSTDRGAPGGHGRGESDTGSYVRERPASSRHRRGESDTGSYVRERPAPRGHGRAEKVVSFRERPAPSRYSRSESDINSYVRERPAASEHNYGERVVSLKERPAPSEHNYGERVVSFKERPAPSGYGRGKSDVIYNIRERPDPNRYDRSESDIVFYVRERPAPSEYGRGERVISYSRERPVPSKHGRGESDIVTCIRERPAAEQPQRPDAHQMAGDRAPSLNLGRDSGLPAWRASNPGRRKPTPPEGDQPVGNAKSIPTPRRNPKPKETPNQDNRGHLQPEQRLYKRVVDPPSLAGFSRFVSPPFNCDKPIDFPPPRGKYEMSGALQSPTSVKRRPRSPAKRERLARNGDIVRNKHRGSRHSSNSSGSNGSARRRGHTVQINQNLNVVLDGRRGRRGKGRLDVKE